MAKGCTGEGCQEAGLTRAGRSVQGGGGGNQEKLTEGNFKEKEVETGKGR